jgi:hypothetical protein
MTPLQPVEATENAIKAGLAKVVWRALPISTGTFSTLSVKSRNAQIE